VNETTAAVEGKSQLVYGVEPDPDKVVDPDYN
jgi:hypothetical protein